MKCKTLINLIVLGILTGMPSIVCAKEQKEKKSPSILQRIYAFKDAHKEQPDSVDDNVYMKYRFNVERRNPTLWLIPNMYVMAKGEREYIKETYNHVIYHDLHELTVKQQVMSGTIRHNLNAMPTLLDLTTPNVYDVALYNGHILSPFNKYNRRYYKFNEKIQADGTTRLEFKPKTYNTQMLSGYAIVNSDNGHIIRTVLNGEFDMISFCTEVQQSDESWPLPTPYKCTTAATFKFVGNRISTVLTTQYNSPATIPDTIENVTSRELMDSLRPIPLSEQDKQIYAKHDEANKPDSTGADTVPEKTNILKKIFWDNIGETLVTPISAESEKVYFELSPIINPFYVRYSDSRGWSYKMSIGSEYRFNRYRYLTFEPSLGYNFKIKQFYYNIPLRMTYNPKRNGYAEIIVANGNRIGNGSVLDEIRNNYGDTLKFEHEDAGMFNNTYIRVFNNIMLFDWLDIEAGVVYNRRGAVDKQLMLDYNMPTEYRSFAQIIGLKILPWPKGPLFSIDWEGTYNVFDSNISYQRWEADASWKYHIPGLRLLNMRLGGGVYTNKQQNYFVDFANFQDDNLPGGWEDGWTGNFMQLDSRVYNESNFYIRANASYESPMLVATAIPYLGKFIEKERFYLGSVVVENSRPYIELGYSFTNRYISLGTFAGFNGFDFQSIGFNFEFELFRRW